MCGKGMEGAACVRKAEGGSIDARCGERGHVCGKGERGSMRTETGKWGRGGKCGKGALIYMGGLIYMGV